MSTLIIEIEIACGVDVIVTDDTLTVNLDDGRTISVPLGWYPRLLYGTEKERNNVKLIGKGEGLHWPDLDEDISIKGLLAGHKSGESQKSLKQWLDKRKK
ncbi:MAG: DUF2442 domain-containing protein [Spirochaetales bacterium]|nr:DUF2442 domain-containing protein [Spirochaetales bacterium]